MRPDYDLVVSGARVIDPESGLDRVLNLGVSGGRIAFLGEGEILGREHIDGRGAVLAPGFIDLHTHEDFPEGERPEFCFPRETAASAMRAGTTTIVGGNCGSGNVPVGRYLALLAAAAPPINCFTLVGSTALRERLGIGPGEAASPGQRAALKEMALSGLDEGAVGVSLGLQYTPGIDFGELLALAQAAAERGRFFAVHLRHDTPGRAREAVEEVLEAARLSGAPLQISHWAANVYGGDNIAGTARLIRDSGLPVGADVYPYDTWATTVQSAVFDQGFDDFNFTVRDLEILSGPRSGQYCTEEIFAELRAAPDDTTVACHRAIPMGDIEAAYREPFVCVGSDAMLTLDDRGRYKGHPRAAGTPARFLGDFVREKNILSLAEGIRRLTLLPAQRLGLDRKGRIQTGCDADLVLFDPDGIADRAEYGIDVCNRPPSGIRAVVCGGRLVYAPGPA